MGRTAADEVRYLAAVDPGTTNLGIALFDRGVLVDAAYMYRPSARDVVRWVRERTRGHATAWVREKMTKYPDRPRSHGDLDAIEDLMARVARILGMSWDMAAKARRWKASVPKPIHHRRLAKFLVPEEVPIWETCNPDSRDAVGIGLYSLKRVGRGGVAPGRRGPAEDSA